MLAREGTWEVRRGWTPGPACARRSVGQSVSRSVGPSVRRSDCCLLLRPRDTRVTRPRIRWPMTTSLRAEPKGVLSDVFVIQGKGRLVIELKQAVLGERAAFVLDGVEYRLGREGFIGDFTLSANERVLA